MQRCIRCLHDYHQPVGQCHHCGWQFDNVTEEELPAWFDEVQTVLENAYVQAPTPWGQSGKGGGYEDWQAARRCIADAIDAPGSFLDIGCANGYLLECLLEWAPHPIEPYGLDVSPVLTGLAQQRLESYRNNFFVGNALTWQPPHRFDYVRVETVCVPKNWEERFIRRLRRHFLTPRGKLLVAEYASSRHDHHGQWVDDTLRAWGLPIDAVHSGTALNGREVTRIAMVPYKGSS